MISQNPFAKFTIVGHSAGADAAILAASRAIEHGMANNISGVVLLDPTLTSSEDKDLGFDDYSNKDEQFGTSDDLGSLLPNIISNNVPVFVGLGSLYGTKDDPLRTYLDPLTTNQVEFAQELYKYEYFGYDHPDMATRKEVRDSISTFAS